MRNLLEIFSIEKDFFCTRNDILKILLFKLEKQYAVNWILKQWAKVCERIYFLTFLHIVSGRGVQCKRSAYRFLKYVLAKSFTLFLVFCTCLQLPFPGNFPHMLSPILADLSSQCCNTDKYFEFTGTIMNY